MVEIFLKSPNVPCTSIPSCTFIVIGMLLLNWNLSLNNTSPYYIVWRQKCFLPYFGTLWDWFGDALEYFRIPICTTIDFPENFPLARLLIFQKCILYVYCFLRKFPPCTSILSCRFNVFEEFSHLHVYFVLHVYSVH